MLLLSAAKMHHHPLNRQHAGHRRRTHLEELSCHARDGLPSEGPVVVGLEDFVQRGAEFFEDEAEVAVEREGRVELDDESPRAIVAIGVPQVVGRAVDVAQDLGLDRGAVGVPRDLAHDLHRDASAPLAVEAVDDAAKGPRPRVAQNLEPVGDDVAALPAIVPDRVVLAVAACVVLSEGRRLCPGRRRRWRRHEGGVQMHGVVWRRHGVGEAVVVLVRAACSGGRRRRRRPVVVVVAAVVVVIRAMGLLQPPAQRVVDSPSGRRVGRRRRRLHLDAVSRDGSPDRRVAHVVVLATDLRRPRRRPHVLDRRRPRHHRRRRRYVVVVVPPTAAFLLVVVVVVVVAVVPAGGRRRRRPRAFSAASLVV
mmetsp:Transcript_8680/g.35752  ORF Transcript_8680/g.35752 Transcript_8680/m.35752 type:complete len:365 (-) Transcript_8680:552-1646(-)